MGKANGWMYRWIGHGHDSMGGNGKIAAAADEQKWGRIGGGKGLQFVHIEWEYGEWDCKV
jgi:hypothetical protein